MSKTIQHKSLHKYDKSISDMKVAIIGSGWYGCHIGLELKKLGANITIFDRNDEIFDEASSKNQNRLHLGFHYPRCHDTRVQSSTGFNRFKEYYPDVCIPIKDNIYSVDDKNSLIDFITFKQIMSSENLKFTDVTSSDVPVLSRFRNLSGCVNTDEELVSFARAKKLFTNELDGCFRLNTEISSTDIVQSNNYVTIFDEKYDYVINCTWNTLELNSKLDFYYEPTVVLLYKPKVDIGSFAMTVMDGNFFSLFPYDDNGLFTLTSVKHTPITKTTDINEARYHLRSINKDKIDSLSKIFEDEISYYYPTFSHDFDLVGHYTAIKTKLNVKSDSRECIVETNDKIISVFSGKIDTIFVASDDIISKLK